MKRIPILGTLLLIPAIAMFIMVGCTSGTKKEGTKEVTPKADDSKVEGPKKTEKIATETSATVSGVVKLKGKAPEVPVEARIAAHKDAPFCMMGKGFNVQEQMWLVNDGKVGNVVVWLGPPAGKEFDVNDKIKEPFKKAVEIDQPFCAYVPHVVAVYSEIQPLVFKNSATVQHNVKMNPGGAIGPSMDEIIPPGKASQPRTYKSKEAVIDAGCSMHNWMTAKVAIFNQPYFAVTNDKGEFKIENVPIDTELTVYVWHESMGALKNRIEGKKASFKKGENTVDGLEVGK